MKLKMDYKWVVLTVTTVGTFMSALDGSIVVIGLPTILEKLNATISHGIWIITGYLLMMTILLVLLGRLADIHGRVKLYTIGFAVFTIGSLLCGLSTNGPQLVGFRFLQGIGAALISVNAGAIITDSFPRNQLGVALGINLMGVNVGAVAGYTLGGVMITLFGWRSIFLVNVPVGIFGTLWAYFRLKDVSIRAVGQKFDYAGSILYCVALFLVLYALAIGNPTSTLNLAILAVGIVLFAVMIIVELRQKYPTLDLSLFKIRLFAVANLTSFFDSLAFNCGPFLRSLYLQLILGFSPLKAGLILIPMEIMVLVLSPISGRLSDKYGSRIISSVGLASHSAALIWFSTLNQYSSYTEIFISMALFGLGRALFASPNSSSIMSAAPAEKRGVANGVRMTLSMPYARLSQIAGSNQLITGNELPTFLHAINLACLILGIIIAAAIIPSMLRGPSAGMTKSTKT